MEGFHLMDLQTLLTEQKAYILEQWGKQLLATYSPDAARIFGKQKDRFANPIGYNVKAGLAELYEALTGGEEPSLGRQVENLIKVRAVQQFLPSEAVAFVFLFKQIVREFARNLEVELDGESLQQLDNRIDRVALQVFDLYMESRERLHQVRIRELEANRHILTDLAKCPSRLARQDKLE
jgi:hypothetical protein